MSRTLLLILVSIAGLRPLSAQCPTVWESGGPQPTLSGSGSCQTQWDPDGAGPLPLRWVVGGETLIGGSQPIDQRVMTWDGSHWEAIGDGPGTSGRVTSLINWNGLLVAAGTFTGGGVSGIALWTGAAWQALGAGFPTQVDALTVWNGMLVAAGSISGSGGSTPIIRTWNGATWTALPSPPSLQVPRAAISYQGLLCVAGGASTQGVLERWNGTSWQPSIFALQAANSIPKEAIRCFAVRPSIVFGLPDTLYVGGSLVSIGGVTATRVASTTGGAGFSWSPVGSGLTHTCNALVARNAGLFGHVVTGVFETTPGSVQRFQSGGAWEAISNTQTSSIGYYAGAYHATILSYWPSARRYDGSQWVPLRGPGISGTVLAATRYGDDMVVGGTFESASGVTMNHIAHWDGSSLQPLGSGITGSTSPSVNALVTLDNGDVVAGGEFASAGGVAASRIARWNGSAWFPLGTGLDGSVLALCTMPNGDLIAGGRFLTAGGVPCSRVARWSGTEWSSLDSGMNGDVRALAVRSDGALFAAGTFTSASGFACSRIAQWVPSLSLWIPVGSGCDAEIRALVARPNGDVVASGAFTLAGGSPADRVARWTGLLWLPMNGAPPGRGSALATLPNGDVVAGFDDPSFLFVPDGEVGRWNGTDWSSFGGRLASETMFDVPRVATIVQRQNGDLIVGGDFTVADGVVSENLARLRPTCPALASSYGTGCSSAAGPLVTTVDALPWVGATFRTKTTGVAANSLCLGLIGLSQLSIPLGSLLPEGQPGCSLLTSLDIMGLTFPVGGVARSELALALDPALIGVTFHQQTVPFEVDGSGAIVAIRAANGITATIGSL